MKLGIKVHQFAGIIFFLQRFANYFLVHPAKMKHDNVKYITKINLNK